MKKTLLLAAAGLATITTSAVASTASPAAGVTTVSHDEPAPAPATTNITVARYRADHQIHADASSTHIISQEIVLHTRQGVEEFGTVYLPFSEKMQRLEVLEAYAIDPQGTRIDVPTERIYTQLSPATADAPVFADHKVKLIVFSGLSPGAKVVYRYRRDQITPYFKGHAEVAEIFSPFVEIADAVVTLTAPAGLALQVKSTDLQGSDTPVRSQGKANWQWRLPYRPAQPLQAHSAPTWRFSPSIMASTFKQWADVGTAYHAKAAPAAAVTPAIQATADRLTAGIHDRREQAAALHQWVAGEIRYVAVYLGNGALEPNPAATVIEHGYGDCKDQVALLQALLAAKGIHSTPALVSAGGGPELMSVPQLAQFNHAVVYVAEFDTYLDPTDSRARFGQLPAAVLGLPAVHTGDGTISRTPVPDAVRAGGKVHMDAVFDRSGSFTARLDYTMGHEMEITFRHHAAQITPQNEEQVARSIMASAGLDGHARFAFSGDPADLGQPFGVTATVEAKHHADFSGNLVLGAPPLPGLESFRHILSTNPDSEMRVPFHCTATDRTEVYALTLPDGIVARRLPADVDFENPAGSYSLTWRKDGQKLMATHRLRQAAARGDQAFCQPQDYAGYRELYRQVHHGFSGLAILEATDGAP